MIIGIDGNEANVIEKVGVSVYTLKLLEYFQKKSSDNLQFVVLLKNDPKKDLPESNKYFRYKVISGKFFWSQIFLPISLLYLYLTKAKINVFFSPAHYVPRFNPFPSVVTIHDLSYMYYPDEFKKNDLYKLKNWTKFAIEKSKKIIAVSNTTKKDIIKFYATAQDKIDVIYNGFEKNLKNIPDFTPSIHSSIKKHKYILYVGTLQPRKNLTALFKAYRKYRNENPDYKLVIVGKKGWMYDKIFREVKETQLEDDVLFLGYVNDKYLSELYRNAFCFVLPSFYEGFGIPVVEAMSFSCPVVCSFSSSLPEIAGDAALYFDPKDENNLFDKLMELKNNLELRTNLIAKGKNRVKMFSWQSCAEKTLEVIKNAGTI